MTREMIDHIAQQIVGPLQWLTIDEENAVMEAVIALLRDKHRRDHAHR